MSDDVAEIIPRPPSSPIGTTLLIVSTLGMILAIAFVWMELFGEYLPAPRPGQQPDPEMRNHVARTEAERHNRDHYAEDFPGSDDVLSAVERDLGVGPKVGDLSASPSGGDAPIDSPEAPDGE